MISPMNTIVTTNSIRKIDAFSTPANFEIVGIVYRATCLVNGKSYIGQTFRRKDLDRSELLRKRKEKHELAARTGSTLPFHAAIRRYGADAFDWRIVAIAWRLYRLNYFESSMIEQSKTLVDDNGYNASSGGDNRIPSRQTRQRMSEAAKARWEDEEKSKLLRTQLVAGREKNAANISEKSRGRIAVLHSPGARAKAAESYRRRWQDPEYRERMSLIRKKCWQKAGNNVAKVQMDRARNSPNWLAGIQAATSNSEYKALMANIGKKRLAKRFTIFNFRTKEPIASFNNIVDAAEFFHVWAQGISATLHGRARSFGGKKYYGRFV